MPTARPLAHVSDPIAELAADVRWGLGRTPKTLPSKYLYDALGSALFEAITELPEYGLTRAEERILGRHAGEIARSLPSSVAIVELGAGSGRKVRPLLAALAARQLGVSYTAIDVSAAALERCAREVERHPGVRYGAIEAPYLAGLERFVKRRPPGTQLLVVFLGSSIGNLDAGERRVFLKGTRALLRPGDTLLVGFDLVKPVERVLPAYDDPLGVTAAFNLNLLARINRELSADFDLAAFRHEARWNEPQRRIEMHLRAVRPQNVLVRGAGCRVSFTGDETIWTESSHKFEPDRLRALAASAGFRESARWVDESWPFADSLWVAS